jgi:cytidyltransferase-like protein
MKRASRFPKAVLGGTFDRLHAGHEALLRAAFDHAEEIGIGLTTDEFLRSSGSSRKTGAVRPFDERRRELQAFLDATFPGRTWYLIPLTDRWGAALEPSIRALVVSDETRAVGALANQIRRRHRTRPLTLVLCHCVLAEDLLRLSSSRIRAGKVDRQGRRLVPLRIGLGSVNEVKRSGVEAAFHRLLPDLPLTVEPTDPGGANPQPWGWEEGVKGALRRAELALSEGRDYGVGVEATALPVKATGEVMDVHAIAIVGADGVREVAFSSAYTIPEPVRRRMLGRTTLEEAVHQIGGPPRAGHSRGGALGYLTAEELSREDAISQAVVSGFVARLAIREGRVPPVEILPEVVRTRVSRSRK